MTRPIEALIHPHAIRHNYLNIKALAPDSRAFAVVKANAYGHGLLRTAQALHDADGFAILEMAGAIALREAGFTQPILLLEGVFSPEELQLAARHDLWLAVHEPRTLEWLENCALARPVTVFLKLNTGMNRLGFPAAQAAAIAARLQACANVAGVTLMTHFATADDPARGIAAQLACFDTAVAGLALPHSVANSAATVAYPETRRDWLRPGIVLYGSSPFETRSATQLGLQAAMTLRSRVIGTQQLRTGDTVGYGATFAAEQAMTIGIVACGYADGYPRHAPTGTPILVDGVRTRLLGRVSMDMLAVDLTALPQSGIGSEVELWGANLSIDEVAAAAGTIGYELMCAIAPRVPVITV
ncbi:alanine racemase [Chitiniphilus shinanonensis]|uniref:Alanine racemase n=1 Tax=Chitiniphilus shinanonensis TaxID=553088 RepID=A0ABQ6C0A1_9NEIS|nr:alanine racemase [Chitiniphilus shinanonensis]GLS05613.1 alanine racemase [Chitiniphilus shinanonensis]